MLVVSNCADFCTIFGTARELLRAIRADYTRYHLLLGLWRDRCVVTGIVLVAQVCLLVVMIERGFEVLKILYLCL